MPQWQQHQRRQLHPDRRQLRREPHFFGQHDLRSKRRSGFQHQGSISTVIFYGELSINSGSSVSISGNDFSNVPAGGVIAVAGDPNAHINLTNNYWGSVDPTQIAEKITDHNTNAALPYIDFQPPVGANDETIAHAASVTFNDSDQMLNLSTLSRARPEPSTKARSHSRFSRARARSEPLFLETSRIAWRQPRTPCPAAAWPGYT